MKLLKEDFFFFKFKLCKNEFSCFQEKSLLWEIYFILFFFQRSGHENVVDMMVARGAPISAKTKNGLAPLHMASQGDHVDAARILLHHKVIY